VSNLIRTNEEQSLQLLNPYQTLNYSYTDICFTARKINLYSLTTPYSK